MNKPKRHPLGIALLVAIAVLVAGLVAGCGGSGSSSSGGGSSDSTEEATPAASGGETESASTDSGETFTVAIDNGAGASIPYTKALVEGIEAGASSLGNVELIGNFDGKADASTEANNVQNIIAQKPDGVIMFTANGEQAGRLVENLTDAGIKVVAVQYRVGSASDVTKPNYVYPGLTGQVAINEVEAGFLSGQLMTEAVPSGGEIGVVLGTTGFPEVKARVDGFKEALDEASAEYDVVSELPGNFNPQDGEKACAGMLQSNPGIKGIFLEADVMVPGCVNAKKAAGSEALLIGMGGSEEGLRLVESGEEYGTSCYLPKSMAEEGIKILEEALSGKSVEGKEVNFPVPTITKKNLSKCEPEYSA